jgi:hypothetical protein
MKNNATDGNNHFFFINLIASAYIRNLFKEAMNSRKRVTQ